MSFVADFSVAPEHREASGLRRDVRTVLAAQGLAEHDLERLVLVIDELVNNAIDHGGAYRGVGDQLMVRVRLRQMDVLIGFVDPSVPAETVEQIWRDLVDHAKALPAIDLERGRGLFLIADAFDRLEIQHGLCGRGMIVMGRMARQGR